MKAILSVLFLIGLFVSSAWAVNHVPSRTIVGADQVIYSAAAIIYDASIYYVGVTAGNKMELRDGTTTSSPAIFTFIAPAAAGTYQVTGPEGFVCDTGLYMDVTITGGAMGLNLQAQ